MTAAPSDPLLARGREDVAAAYALLAAGFPSQAVSRAYTAAFHAAGAALLAVGDLPAELPPSHPGVVAAFGRRVAADGGLGHEHGRVLRRLLEHRDDVDEGLAAAPAEAAQAAVGDAARLLRAVEGWIAGRA